MRQGFTSKERDDETGLDYFEARYYSSTMGRFTSPDEFTGGPTELFAEVAAHNPTFYADFFQPQSLNKYQYCLNNPLKFVDPDGHQEAVADFLKWGAQQVQSSRLPKADKAAAIIEGAAALVYFMSQGENTDADPSCRACPSGLRVAESMRDARQREADRLNIRNQDNSGNQGNSSQGGSNSGERNASESSAGGSPGRTPHGEKRKREADSGNANRQVGDANRVIREGRKFHDRDSGNTVHVSGNRVVIVKPDGEIHSQFTNRRKNTQQRIRSGKWEPIE